MRFVNIIKKLRKMHEDAEYNHQHEHPSLYRVQ